jgi:hypothetical protein
MKLSRSMVLVALALPIMLAASIMVLWGAIAGAAWWKADAFYAVTENAPRAAVIAALGQPDMIRACGKNLWWGDDSQYRGLNDGRCVTEERYEYFLTAYGVGYSAEGLVVSKYRYFSE